MSMFKKFRDKFLENYHSYKSYFFIRLFLILIVSLISIVWIVEIIDLILKGSETEDILYVLNGLLFAIFFWFVLNWIIQLIYSSSWKIKENMKKLPKDDFWERVIVQYSLPKEITPSEAAILLYGRSELSNLLSIICWWINSKIVDLHTKDGKKYIETSCDFLWRSFPLYERDLFSCIFNRKDGKIVILNKKLLNKYKNEVNDMIVVSCEEKWYIVKSKGTVWSNFVSKIMNFLVPCFVVIMSIFCLLAFVGWEFILWIPLFILLRIFLYARQINRKNDREITGEKTTISISLILFIVWFLCFLYFIIWEYLLWCLMLVIIFFVMYIRNQNKSYDMELTDKWKKILWKIYGYKYYLENCEEDEINSNLWEDEVYTKHLPWAVALKLNWKIIDELS